MKTRTNEGRDTAAELSGKGVFRPSGAHKSPSKHLRFRCLETVFVREAGIAFFVYDHQTSKGCVPQLLVGCQSSRNLQRDKEVTGENIVVKVTERQWGMKLAGRDPSIRIGPLPADC